jgi:exopolysaccharide biosynthesis polyprenyl glycosylphosphotransferase
MRTYEDPRRTPQRELFWQISKATVLATLLFMGVLFTLRIDFASRSLVAAFTAVNAPTVFLARLALNHAMRRWLAKSGSWNLLIVGNASEARPLISALERHQHWGIRVIGFIWVDQGRITSPLPILGALPDLPRVLERETVDQVFLTGRTWDVESLRFIADSCEELGVRFSMDANFLGLKTARVQLDDFDGSGVLTFSATPTDTTALAVKRMMDVVLSGLALLALTPVFIGVAAVVKYQDRGPVLFAQERSGLYGRRFKMLKFRSMVIDAEARRRELEHMNEMSGPVFKIAADPRITRFGAFIRKTSIDELPQFWNVFIGEMSLVGPRPPLPAETEKYERWQLRRLSMKPGITCIWQVSGRNNIDFETWMKLDLEYIDNWSLLLDVKLLLRTVPVVLFGVGAR